MIVFHYHNNRILISSKRNMKIKLYSVKHKQTSGYFRANKPNKLESVKIVPISVKDIRIRILTVDYVRYFLLRR